MEGDYLFDYTLDYHYMQLFSCITACTANSPESSILENQESMMTIWVKMFPTPESSNVAAIGYDSKRRDLYVRFKNGRVYRYDPVPPGIFVGFKEAASKGIYLNREIKGKFDADDVTSADIGFIEADGDHVSRPAPLKPVKDPRWAW